MLKGVPWTREEEKQLKQMLEANKSVRVIAKALGKTRDCVRMKIARLDIEVVVQQNSSTTSSCRAILLGLLAARSKR
jgi:IS30 family transposase